MVGNVDACIHEASGFFIGPHAYQVSPVAEYEAAPHGRVVRDRSAQQDRRLIVSLRLRVHLRQGAA